MPIVCSSGGAASRDREAELYEVGTNTLTARHPDPQPVSPARSNLSGHGHDEDWGAPPPPGAYYDDNNIASSYSLELEYLNDCHTFFRLLYNMTGLDSRLLILTIYRLRETMTKHDIAA
jgi:hypothetical protein